MTSLWKMNSDKQKDLFHEDRCWVKVEAEKPEGRAGHCHGKHRGVDASRPCGENEHGQRRDARDPCGKPVESVDEVDDVDVGNEIDDRGRVGEPSKLDVPRLERVVYHADDKAAHGGDGGGGNLTGELLLGRERVSVIEQARHENDHEREANHPVVDLKAWRGREGRGPVQERGTHGLDDEGCDDA